MDISNEALIEAIKYLNQAPVPTDNRMCWNPWDGKFYGWGEVNEQEKEGNIGG